MTQPTNPDAVRDALADEFAKDKCVTQGRWYTHNDVAGAFIAGYAAALKQAPEVLRLKQALMKIGRTVDQISAREKTSIEIYIREYAREALAEIERGK